MPCNPEGTACGRLLVPHVCCNVVPDFTDCTQETGVHPMTVLVEMRHEASIDRPIDDRRPEIVDLRPSKCQNDPVCCRGDVALRAVTREMLDRRPEARTIEDAVDVVRG